VFFFGVFILWLEKSGLFFNFDEKQTCSSDTLYIIIGVIAAVLFVLVVLVVVLVLGNRRLREKIFPHTLEKNGTIIT